MERATPRDTRTPKIGLHAPRPMQTVVRDLRANHANHPTDEPKRKRGRDMSRRRHARTLVIALVGAGLGSSLGTITATASPPPTTLTTAYPSLTLAGTLTVVETTPGMGTLTLGPPVMRTPRGGGTQVVSAPSISGDGKVMAFESSAQLRPHDRSGGADVFVAGRSGEFWRPYRARDVETGTSTLIHGAVCPTLSRDARYVVFTSSSGQLVPGDTNGVTDVFRADRVTHHIDLLSTGLAGQSADAPSGQSVNCQGSGGVSADGRYVAFGSLASNLVPGDTNNWWDVFVRDMTTGRTERVSVDSAGRQAHNDSALGGLSAIAMSGDGRYVVFPSYANNLVPGDTNRLIQDLFLHDRRTHTTERVSLTDTGGQIEQTGSFYPSVSDDGRYIAFDSDADGIDHHYPPDGTTDIFLRDRLTATTTQVSARNGISAGSDGFGYSGGASISADGSIVTFNTTSAVLRQPGTPAFTPYVVLYSTATGRTFPLTVSSTTGVISADGTTLAYLKLYTPKTYGNALYTSTLTWTHPSTRAPAIPTGMP